MARILSVIAVLAAVAAVSVLASSDDSSAEDNEWSDGLEYKIVQGVLSITPVEDGKEHTYRMYDFTPGTQPWYGQGEMFLGVYVKASNIGNYAFYGMESIIQVVLDLTGEDCSVGSYQFYGTDLVAFDGDCVKKMGKYALAHCRSLSEISLGEGFRCSDDVLSTLFVGDPLILNFDVSDNNPDFDDCGQLQLTSKGKDGKILYRYATGNTGGEQGGYDYRIPDGVTTLFKNAFESSTYLTMVDLNGTEIIGDMAFQNCQRLTVVNFSETVTYVGTSAFYGSTNLFAIIVNENNTHFQNDVKPFDGTLYATDGEGRLERLICCPPRLLDLDGGVFKLPDTVTEICAGALAFNKKIKEVVLSDGLKIIGEKAFENCDIPNIEIPASVEYIADHAFLKCYQLKYAVIRGAEKIGVGIFAHCIGLTRVFDYSGHYDDMLSVPVHVVFQMQKDAEILDYGAVSGRVLTLPTVKEPQGYFALWGVRGFMNGETTTIDHTESIKQYWDPGIIITFDSAGGTPVVDQRIPAGKSPIRPSDPVRDGYVFAYWKTPIGKDYDFSSELDENTVLTAEWVKKTNITDNSWLMVAAIVGCLIFAGVMVRYMHSEMDSKK